MKETKAVVQVMVCSLSEHCGDERTHSISIHIRIKMDNQDDNEGRIEHEFHHWMSGNKMRL